MSDPGQMPAGRARQILGILESVEPSRRILEDVKSDSGYNLGANKLRKFWNSKKKTLGDLRHPHFAKLAVMIGRGTTSPVSGTLSSAYAPSQPFDAPQMSQSARGAGDSTPPKAKNPGMSLRKQAINPRMRLVDAMNKGMA